MNELKKSLLQSMQTASHEIKYHKQFIESVVRTYREKTKGDVWAEMLDWYDFLKDLEYACAEIRRQLWMYHDLHDFIKEIDLHGVSEIDDCPEIH